jgi:hypothetical protein
MRREKERIKEHFSVLKFSPQRGVWNGICLTLIWAAGGVYDFRNFEQE